MFQNFFVLFLTFSHSISSVSINSPCNKRHYKVQNDVIIRGDSSNRNKRGATSSQDSLWPNAVVPFTISPQFREHVRRNILSAIEEWEQHTCIKFVTHSNESYGLKFEPQSCGCCSFVGRQQFSNGRPQELSIKGSDCEDIGHMLHEIGHALGFWHEHVRPDRGKYIKVYKNNVLETAEHNFEKKNMTEVNSLGEAYDYASIMHYSAQAFSVNPNKRTLVPIEKSAKIGQRSHLSPGDIIQANKLYKCPVDENQCAIGNGGCEHMCHDLQKGFMCTCRTGYTLGEDKRTCDLTCGGSVIDLEGSIFSPNYPQPYPKDASCMWTLRAPIGYLIKINFQKFDLEFSNYCDFDTLNIDIATLRLDSPWDQLAVLCGKKRPQPMLIKSNEATVRFKSDFTLRGGGFRINYKFVPGKCMYSNNPMSCFSQLGEQHYPARIPRQNNRLITNRAGNCDREYTSHRGLITTPSNAHTFGDLNCIIKIKVKPKRVVLLTIHLLDLTVSPGCSQDSLVIKKDKSLTPVGTFCGKLRNHIIKTDKNFVWLNFKLASQEKRSRYSITYRSIRSKTSISDSFQKNRQKRKRRL